MDATRQKRPGFTLIELLVVVAIIALLISILLPSLSKAREQARTVQCSSIQKQIGFANSMYADAYGGSYVSLYDQFSTAATTQHVLMSYWILRPAFRTQLGLPSDFRDVSPAEEWWPGGLDCPDMADRHKSNATFSSYGFNHDYSSLGTLPAAYPHRPSITQPSSTFQLLDANDIRIAPTGRDYRTNWDLHGEQVWFGGESGNAASAMYRHNEGAPILHYDGHVAYFSKQEAYPADDTARIDQLWTIYKDN